MDPRSLNMIFGLITIAAIGFGIFAYVNSEDETTESATPPPAVVVSSAPTANSSPLTSTSPSPPTTVTPAPSSRTFNASQSLSVPNETVTLEAGQSLFSIAQENGVKVADLAKLNNISDVNTVYEGQTILIPDDASTQSFTILFVTNTARLAKEKKKLETGSTSIYNEAIAAARADTKGIYGIADDAPFSKSNESETKVTLSSSDSEKLITIDMEKDSSGLWLTKKLVIKLATSST